MAVRWTITFKTLTNRNGLVKVYDSNYSGDPIAIEPAVNAFSTTRQQADFFEPVVPDTGYLRVIDNDIVAEAIEDIHPLGALDRPVEFYLDNVLQWRGYISPESFTMSWEPAPHVVDFPLVGVLNVLDSVNIQDNRIEKQPIAAFIKEILTATGFSWDNVILAQQMAALDAYEDFPEFRLVLSRYAFVKRNDSQNTDDPDWTTYVGDTYLTVLKKICSYFGWTASQNGADLVLTNSRIDLLSAGFNALSWSGLSSIAADFTASVTPTSVMRPVLSLLSMDFDGTAHRKSIRTGHKKATVRTDLGTENNLFPQLLFNGDQVAYYEHKQYVAISQGGGLYINGRAKFLDPSKENVQLYVYEYDEIRGVWVRSSWSAPAGETFPVTPRADLVSATCFESGELAVTDPNHAYDKYLRLAFMQIVDSGSGSGSGGSSSVYLPSNRILAEISAPEVGFFAAGGALCFTARVRTNYIKNPSGAEPGVSDEEGLTPYGVYVYNLRISIKIGDKYFDGTNWVDEPEVIEVKVDSTKSGYGIGFPGDGLVKDTNENQYENALGFIVPIPEDMSGRLEVLFYPPSYYGTGTLVNTLFLRDFSVNYFNNYLSKDKGVRISSLTGKAFKSDVDVTLNMSSLAADQAPVPSNAYLFYGAAPIGSENIIEYCDEDETTLAQPEYWLLDSLIKAYSKPAEWLELEVSLSDNILLYSVITYNSKRYLVVGIDTDYDSEHIRLWIASYE